MAKLDLKFEVPKFHTVKGYEYTHMDEHGTPSMAPNTYDFISKLQSDGSIQVTRINTEDLYNSIMDLERRVFQLELKLQEHNDENS